MEINIFQCTFLFNSFCIKTTRITFLTFPKKLNLINRNLNKNMYQNITPKLPSIKAGEQFSPKVASNHSRTIYDKYVVAKLLLMPNKAAASPAIMMAAFRPILKQRITYIIFLVYHN